MKIISHHGVQLHRKLGRNRIACLNNMLLMYDVGKNRWVGRIHELRIQEHYFCDLLIFKIFFISGEYLDFSFLNCDSKPLGSLDQIDVLVNISKRMHRCKCASLLALCEYFSVADTAEQSPTVEICPLHATLAFPHAPLENILGFQSCLLVNFYTNLNIWYIFRVILKKCYIFYNLI